MIQARRLGHVVLKVRDVQKSKEFYTRTLGLQVASEQTEWGAVFLSVGEQHHDLALFQLATGEKPAATQPGLHHMAWQLGSFAELQAAHRELRDLGVQVDATIAHNVTRSIYFADPDGNRLEIYYEIPGALARFPEGRGDQNYELAVSRSGEPLPAWLSEQWPRS